MTGFAATYWEAQMIDGTAVNMTNPFNHKRRITCLYVTVVFIVNASYGNEDKVKGDLFHLNLRINLL
jgi:hypothetical protein